LARTALREVPGLLSAEFFTRAGLDVLAGHAGLAPPLREPVPAFLLLEAAGPDAAEDLAGPAGAYPVAVATTPGDRARLGAYRERAREAAGFLGVPLKLDVPVPAARWVTLAAEVGEVVRAVDPGARLIIYGHVADGNLHVNVVPAAEADGRHEDAVFGFVASLGGAISAQHRIGAPQAPRVPPVPSA